MELTIKYTEPKNHILSYVLDKLPRKMSYDIKSFIIKHKISPVNEIRIHSESKIAILSKNKLISSENALHSFANNVFS